MRAEMTNAAFCSRKPLLKYYILSRIGSFPTLWSRPIWQQNKQSQVKRPVWTQASKQKRIKLGFPKLNCLKLLNLTILQIQNYCVYVISAWNAPPPHSWLSVYLAIVLQEQLMTKLLRSWECSNVQKKHDTISESIFSMLIFLPTFLMHVFVIQYFGMNQHLPSYHLCYQLLMNNTWARINVCLLTIYVINC